MNASKLETISNELDAIILQEVTRAVRAEPLLVKIHPTVIAAMCKEIAYKASVATLNAVAAEVQQ